MITIETKLNNMIEDLYNDIKTMTPTNGFSSPRDLKLVTEINKKSAILDKLQEGMRIIHPYYDIKE